MVVVVVLAAVVAGLVLAWELRYVALWVLVRTVDVLEGSADDGRRSYDDFRRVVAEQGLAGVDLAWRTEPDRDDVPDRADWQLRSAC